MEKRLKMVDVSAGNGKEFDVNVTMETGEVESFKMKADQTLSFPEGSLELVRVFDVCQYMGDSFIPFIESIHKAMIPGGIVSIRVPEYPCAVSISNPLIKRYFTPFTFGYFEGLFNVMHTEVVEQASGAKDRGMHGTFDSSIYIEMIKPDPEMEKRIAEKMAAIADIPRNERRITDAQIDIIPGANT